MRTYKIDGVTLEVTEKGTPTQLFDIRKLSRNMIFQLALLGLRGKLNFSKGSTHVAKVWTALLKDEWMIR